MSTMFRFCSILGSRFVLLASSASLSFVPTPQTSTVLWRSRSCLGTLRLVGCPPIILKHRGLHSSTNDNPVADFEYDTAADPHGLLKRFIQTHKQVFPNALEEIRSGRKVSHWSWFIFPTPPFFRGGMEAGSPTNIYYALRTPEQGKAYLRLPKLDGVDLRSNYITIMQAICQQLRDNPDLTLVELVGSADTSKLESSLAYFSQIAEDIGDEEVHRVCEQTLELINECEARPGPWRKWVSDTVFGGQNKTK